MAGGCAHLRRRPSGRIVIGQAPQVWLVRNRWPGGRLMSAVLVGEANRAYPPENKPNFVSCQAASQTTPDGSALRRAIEVEPMVSRRAARVKAEPVTTIAPPRGASHAPQPGSGSVPVGGARFLGAQLGCGSGYLDVPFPAEPGMGRPQASEPAEVWANTPIARPCRRRRRRGAERAGLSARGASRTARLRLGRAPSCPSSPW
jgi:hypothetical protein